MRITSIGAVLGVITLGTQIAGAIPVGAATASLTLTAGTLGFAAPAASPHFGALTSSGGRRVATATLGTLHITDTTGTQGGWELQVAGTAWSGLSQDDLASTSVVVTGVVSGACEGDAGCALARNTVDYSALTLPLGSDLPVAVYRAEALTGQGEQNVALGLALSTPTQATSGSHQSLWTVSLATGP